MRLAHWLLLKAVFKAIYTQKGFPQESLFECKVILAIEQIRSCQIISPLLESTRQIKAKEATFQGEEGGPHRVGALGNF